MQFFILDGHLFTGEASALLLSLVLVSLDEGVETCSSSSLMDICLEVKLLIK
jgi:hypothetical protein